MQRWRSGSSMNGGLRSVRFMGRGHSVSPSRCQCQDVFRWDALPGRWRGCSRPGPMPAVSRKVSTCQPSDAPRADAKVCGCATGWVRTASACNSNPGAGGKPDAAARYLHPALISPGWRPPRSVVGRDHVVGFSMRSRRYCAPGSARQRQTGPLSRRDQETPAMSSIAGKRWR